MTILHVPVTAANEVEWRRRLADATNQIIRSLADYQPLDEQLSSLGALDYTGNAAKVIAVTAGEDGFELVAQAGGGSGIADGDYGDIVVSGTGTAINFDSSVVTAFAKSFLDDVDAAAVRSTLSAAASSHSHAQSDLTGLTTADSPQFAGVNLGHASDTTLTRVSAGVAAIEGVNIVTTAGGVTFTNDISVPAEAYGSGWNGNNEVPTKNDVYDKIEAFAGWTVETSWDFAVSGATATITSGDLTAYSEALIIYEGNTASSSGVRAALVSVDGGTNYLNTSGDYKASDGTGTISNEAAIFVHSTASTASRGGGILVRLKPNGAPKQYMTPDRSFARAGYITGTLSPINRIRLANLTTAGAAAGNLTSGKVWILVR